MVVIRPQGRTATVFYAAAANPTAATSTAVGRTRRPSPADSSLVLMAPRLMPAPRRPPRGETRPVAEDARAPGRRPATAPPAAATRTRPPRPSGQRFGAGHQGPPGRSEPG